MFLQNSMQFNHQPNVNPPLLFNNNSNANIFDDNMMDDLDIEELMECDDIE